MTHKALVTGSAGLAGSAVADYLLRHEWEVWGIDNNMRAEFFGPEADTQLVSEALLRRHESLYHHLEKDIRSYDAYDHITCAGSIDMIVHCAGQPSHDWASEHPMTDWDVNATATLRLLEWYRHICPNAVFIFMSTNKVYGDSINRFRFDEEPLRWEPYNTRLFMHGADEDLPMDRSLHSLFGVSKAAADLMVQEYGCYFGLKTVCFRCGCLTGGAHRGVKQHGFLAYLAKCVREGHPYTIIGHGGKQVRDNLHAEDVAAACVAAYNAQQERPRHGDVFNLGGGRERSVSVLQALVMLQDEIGNHIAATYEPLPRKGDHIWWISDTTRFNDWTAWEPAWTLDAIMKELASGQEG
jgi:CDP-paratose 2-epimerase